MFPVDTPSASRTSRSATVGSGKSGRDPKALIELHLPFVRQLVAGIERRLPREQRGDLLGVAHLALVKAAQVAGDRQRGDFRAYLRLRIRGAIFDEFRRRDLVPRRVREEITAGRRTASAAELPPLSLDAVPLDGTSLHEIVGDGARADGFSALDRADQAALMANAIAVLPADQRRVILQAFVEHRSGREIARAHGVTPSRISQIKRRALQSLRQRLTLGLQALSQGTSPALLQRAATPAPRGPRVSAVPVSAAADEDFRALAETIEELKDRIRELEAGLDRHRSITS